MDLDDVLAYLRGCEWIDLTHAFEPRIPRYAPFPDEQRRVVFGFKPSEEALGSGFLVHEHRHVGQRGESPAGRIGAARGAGDVRLAGSARVAVQLFRCIR
jgi:hypothetical protein